MKRSLILVAMISATAAAAAEDTGVGDSRAATGGARPPQMNEGFIGRDVPSFDPGSDVMSFDGKIWNINNNRLLRARFEKYLNAPAATGASASSTDGKRSTRSSRVCSAKSTSTARHSASNMSTMSRALTSQNSCPSFFSCQAMP